MSDFEDRVNRGEASYQELSLGGRTAAGLPQYDLVPGMGDWVTASLFGEVWGRPQLPKKIRSIATMTVLTVTGKEPQLKGHIGYALNLGWTKEELGEMFMHLVFYAGLPSTLNALSVARVVFEERGLMEDGFEEAEGGESTEERIARGHDVLDELSLGHADSASLPQYALAEGMGDWVKASLFGDVWGRPGLEKKVRSIATMSALCALGRLPQLKGHIDFALNLGWSREEVGELFMHLVYYCGLPACLNALGVAKEVFDERDAAV